MTSKAIQKFTSIASVAQSRIDKFKAELDKDPAYALSWGNNVFQAAASLKIANMLVQAFKEDCDIEAARSTITDRIMHRARHPAQSTSPTSNLMEQYELAAYTEALDELKYM